MPVQGFFLFYVRRRGRRGRNGEAVAALLKGPSWIYEGGWRETFSSEWMRKWLWRHLTGLSVSLAVLAQRRRMMSRLSSFDQRGLWLHDQRDKKIVKSGAATQKHLLKHDIIRANSYSCGLFPFDYINQDEFQLKLRENVLHTATLLKRDDKTESFK